MKSALGILAVGLVVCAVAFCGFYVYGTASRRAMFRDQSPELAWLKNEFGLSDTELNRITRLHEAYQPHCQAMCRRIDEQNDRLQNLLTHATTVTPDIEAAIAETARLRGECQRDMLRHFFEVSQTMPPAQGRRYLAWISERTFLPAHGQPGMGHKH